MQAGRMQPCESMHSKELQLRLEELGGVGELEVFRGERVLVAEGDGGGRACGRVNRVYGVLLREKRQQGVDNRGQVGGDSILSRAVRGAIFSLRQPADQIGKTRNQEGARREGYAAKSEKATDVGYADETSREHSFLGGGGKGGMDRLGVVLFSDVAGIGIVRGGKGGSFTVFIVCGGGMRHSSEIMSSWGKAGGRRRIE